MQIVTNSLPIANLFASSRETDLVFLGGYIYPRTGVALGPLTVRMMDDIHVHQTILSAGGMTAKGLFNSNMLLVETERQMMRCADEVVVVADHTKIGRQALAFLCEWAMVDTLIVDKDLTPEQRGLIEQTDTRLVIAGDANARDAFQQTKNRRVRRGRREGGREKPKRVYGALMTLFFLCVLCDLCGNSG